MYSGRRAIDYRVEAESKEEAMERCVRYLSLLGVVITTPIEINPDENI